MKPMTFNPRLAGHPHIIRNAPARLAAVAILVIGLATSVSAQTAPAAAEVPAPTAAPAPAAPPRFSAAALYNAANAYARQGRPGLAVLDYQRARLLDPTDADIAANLAQARASAGLSPVARTPWDAIAAAATPNAVAWLGLLGILLTGGAALAGLTHPRQRGKAWATAVVGVLLLGLPALHAAALWPTLHGAVVLTQGTPVRASPVPLGDPQFALPEGETVTLRALHDEFLLIETGAGRTGWVSRANVAPIVDAR